MDKIYCDMDGVLANFNKEANAVARYKTEKGFFKRLEPIMENLKAIIYLIKNGHDVTILSASPNTQADEDKIEWLMQWLPELNIAKVILCRVGDIKADYVEDIENAILIDDYHMNTKEWADKGGKTILVEKNINILTKVLDNLTI